MAELVTTQQPRLVEVELVVPTVPTVALARQLTEQCDAIEDSGQIAALLLRLKGGGDGAAPDEIDVHGWGRWEKAVTRIERLPVATLLTASGELCGAAVQLLLVADQRIVTRSTRLSFPEVAMGSLPGMALHRLGKYVGLGHAKQLVLGGRTIDADAAQGMGLVDVVADQLDWAVAETTARLTAMPGTALTLARRLLLESFALPNEEAIGSVLAAQDRVRRERSP